MQCLVGFRPAMFHQLSQSMVEFYIIALALALALSVNTVGTLF